MTTSTTPRRPPSRRALARRRVRVLAWRWRHLIAATAVALAALVALDEIRPPPPPTQAVVVLRTDRTAGSLLSVSDVVVREIPAGLAPDGALTSPDDVAGARLAVALPAGFPLPSGVLVGPRLADGAPAGTVVVPVRLGDAGVARLLGAGDRVDLLQAAGDGAQGPATVLARAALVLARAGEEGGGTFGAVDGEAPLLLVAVSPEVATLLSGASTWAPLSAVMVGS